MRHRLSCKDINLLHISTVPRDLLLLAFVQKKDASHVDHHDLFAFLRPLHAVTSCFMMDTRDCLMQFLTCCENHEPGNDELYNNLEIPPPGRRQISSYRLHYLLVGLLKEEDGGDDDASLTFAAFDVFHVVGRRCFVGGRASRPRLPPLDPMCRVLEAR